MEFDYPLPDKWKWMTLGELAEPRGRSIVSGPFGSNIGSRFFTDAGIPVIRGNNLTTGTQKFVDNGFVFVTPDKARELGNVDAVVDDIIFTAAGSLGQVGIIPRTARFPIYIISNKQMRVRLNRELIDPLFAFQWLSSAAMVSFIKRQNTGSSVPLINLSIIRRLSVPLPPLAEQKVIAAVLGALDDKIELNRRMNATLEAMAQTLFKSWFVDAVRSGLPKGWRQITIRELASNIQYGLTQSASTELVGPRFLRITDIQGGKVNWGNVPYCKVSPEEHERYRIKHGDILVARTGASTGENIYLPIAPDAVFASYLVRFQFADPSMARLVGAFMRTPAYFDFVKGCLGGSAQPNASAQVLAGADLPVAQPELVKRFAETVAPLDLRIAANNEESHSLAALRDTLLPRLLSGELRVPNN